MTDNLLDLSLLLEISKGLAGQAAVDLETVDESGDSDETVGLDVLVESLSGLLLEDDGVLGLVLDYSRNITLVQLSMDKSVDLCVRVRKEPIFWFPGYREIEDHSVMGDDEDGGSIPLPLDHFFFCLPAGAYLLLLVSVWAKILCCSARTSYSPF